MTALDLIASSMRLIGVLASGETPSDAEAEDSLMVLNQMLDSWNAERLSIFTIARQVFNLTTAQQTYSMGLGGDFNVPRPPRIDRASIISLTNVSQPLELPIDYLTDAQWQGIPVKNINSSLPQSVWDTGDWPLRFLNYWPIPNQAVQTALYTWTAVSQFADLTTDNTFPPGYIQAIRYNLALFLGPEFNLSVRPDIAQLAVATKAIVKTINVPIVEAQIDSALLNPRGGAYDYRSDLPAGSRRW